MPVLGPDAASSRNTTAHTPSTSIPQNRKRNKALKRQRRHNKRKRAKIPQITVYSSRVITCLDNTSFGLPCSGDSPSAFLKAPEELCISRNPDESIQFLRRIYGVAKNLYIDSIQLDFTACKELGVGAVTIMEIILTECFKWRKSVKCPIHYSGVVLPGPCLAHNPEVNRLLIAGGIFKHLKLKIGNEQQIKRYANIESLKLQVDGTSSNIATLVIEHLDHSLDRHNWELTSWGKNHLGHLVGEVVDNCFQHGGPDAIWYTIGHYAYDGEEKSGKCWLTMLDFGKTIYEGLKDTTGVTRKRINHYIKRSRNWFTAQESEEVLYTLFSLQQRASRFASRKDVIRGNGTVAFLEAFQQLLTVDSGPEKSLLSITSGRCSILFDGTYSFKEVTYAGGYTNKIIAFNSDNDLKKDPDPRYVRSIENGFPGTVISFEWHIGDTHVSRKD